MTKLTQKNVKFYWGEKEETAFQLIKQNLCSAPILALPKGSENFIVYCDASHKRLGAMLMQNEKKCLSDKSIPLEELRVDDELHFVEEPVEVMDREIKQLKRSRIPIIKVRWNSKRGPESTWEREDQCKQKYPHLFSKTVPSSSATS
nr:putative reverse transcriptase domain-containing protein [Tanacetum cinerariifolium]